MFLLFLVCFSGSRCHVGGVLRRCQGCVFLDFDFSACLHWRIQNNMTAHTHTYGENKFEGRGNEPFLFKQNLVN